MSQKYLHVSPGTRVAFQGEPGSFSQHAGRKIFGSGIESSTCFSFEDVFNAVVRGKAECGVIPIENTLAGSIHQNYDLLARHPLEIVAETSLRVEHHLIVHPGTGLRQIKQVYSHPAALEQCKRLLRRLKTIEKVSFYDTAGSVKFIRDSKLRTAAAIASEDAAHIYEMKILRRGIEDDPENYTRFLALSRRGNFPRGGIKTSIVFGLKSEPGVLFKALSVFALRNIDLSKIESRPIRGRPWEYQFYLDLQIDARTRECLHAFRHLREMAPYFKVLGSYPVF
ncbi:MAG TPA: prephenate dehydratase [Acidobacteriota bacterium]|nr:prephenate dehydratase [Acidobacteriota bacterium]